MFSRERLETHVPFERWMNHRAMFRWLTTTLNACRGATIGALLVSLQQGQAVVSPSRCAKYLAGLYAEIWPQEDASGSTSPAKPAYGAIRVSVSVSAPGGSWP